jgi:hypothetical protein
MGNMMGSASGSAAGASGGATGAQAAGNSNMAMQAGMGMMQQGAQQGNQQEMLINQLARMGPPPAMNTSPMPVVGQDIVGKYGANLKPPNVNYRTRQDNQMNPSVGQLITGAA